MGYRPRWACVHRSISLPPKQMAIRGLIQRSIQHPHDCIHEMEFTKTQAYTMQLACLNLTINTVPEKVILSRQSKQDGLCRGLLSIVTGRRQVEQKLLKSVYVTHSTFGGIVLFNRKMNWFHIHSSSEDLDTLSTRAINSTTKLQRTRIGSGIQILLASWELWEDKILINSYIPILYHTHYIFTWFMTTYS